MKRRNFLKKASVGTAVLATAPLLSCGATQEDNTENSQVLPAKSNINTATLPVAICTWNYANTIKKTGEFLAAGETALDAVEKGVMLEEADPANQSVGLGGRPDREGRVTLDACIMNGAGDCGAVMAIENIKHPISVARKVMEETPHVQLAGDGALQFAKEMGFEEENLLTPESKKAWEEWKKESNYAPIINIENHDTIGMLCVDEKGEIAGACTTSGLMYKMRGRVGDSPIIGAGLYIDGDIGGATATGMGEAVVKSVGSFLVVELMRQGLTPYEACKAAVERTIKKSKNYKEIQVGFIAVNKKGETGGYCIQPGFSYAKYQDGKYSNTPGESYIKP